MMRHYCRHSSWLHRPCSDSGLAVVVLEAYSLFTGLAVTLGLAVVLALQWFWPCNDFGFAVIWRLRSSLKTR